MVLEFEPYDGLTAIVAEPASDLLSPSLSAPPLVVHAFSLSLKNIKTSKQCHILKASPGYGMLWG